MFCTDEEYVSYKAAELENAVTCIIAERRRSSSGVGDRAEGENRAAADDQECSGLDAVTESPVTLWIDKV